MWKTILNILFPKHCLGCNRESEFLCYSCFKNIPLNTEETKNNLLIASYYRDPLVKKLIHSYKYDFVKDLANPLGLLMVKKLKSPKVRPQLKSNLALIPVPLHRKRLRWRGFNQSELLAQVISKNLNIPVMNNILIRKKYSLPQAQIQNADLRKDNIKNSFRLSDSRKLINKNIILVDDICTSGSTINECIKVLKTSNHKSVWKLVIAKD